MGFSVSGSLAIVFIGLFIGIGGIYTVTSNMAEQVQDANQDQRHRFDSIQETAINVTSVDRLDSCGIDLNVTNEGSTTLSVNRTDVLVDGEYQTGWRDAATVDGNATDVWLPNQTMAATFTDGIDTDPKRVKVVTDHGVAATGFPTGTTAC